jgi:hypothetical protein
MNEINDNLTKTCLCLTENKKVIASAKLSYVSSKNHLFLFLSECKNEGGGALFASIFIPVHK